MGCSLSAPTLMWCFQQRSHFSPLASDTAAWMPGTLTPEAAIGLLGDWNLRPSELEKSITRKHIFTHIVWEMRGIYAQVREKAPEFTWMTPGEIDTQAALPTAFRLFWEETEHV